MGSILSSRLARGLVAGTLFAAAGTVLLAVGQSGQRPAQPTFKTQVNVVQVDAFVTDAQGRFVPDLTQDDFEVLENGTPQRIANTLVVNIPIERVEAPLFTANAPAVKPDVQSNAKPWDGRLYLIVLDDLQTASTRTNIARQIARDFIEKNLAPNDLAAVIPTSGNRKNTQELTSDRRLLLQAVNQFVGRKIVSPGVAGLSLGTPESSQAGSVAAMLNDPAGPERIFNARSTLQTLSDIARFAGRVRDRRKAIVFVSEGIDYAFGAVNQMTTVGDRERLGFVHTGSDTAAREIRDRLTEFIEAANRGNVTLYAFDPRVYTHGGDEFVDIGALLPDDMTREESANVKSTTILDDLEASQDNLRTMANETGGFAVTGSPKALQNGFERVRTETSNYYIIGYYPANEARDGKFRKIDVRVTRPGLKVTARRGWMAPKGSAAPVSVDAKAGTSPQVYEALASALPVSGFTLSASAAPFQFGKEASVAIIVQVPGTDLKFTRKGDGFEDSVELSVVALDRTGKTRGGERTTIDMPLSEKMHAFVAQSGLVFPIRLMLPPGQYQLRIAGRDGGSGKVGSVHYELEVPDFAAAPLTMSGVVLTAAEAGQVPNPRPDPEIKKMLPASPITAREFAASDTLAVFAEVYDNKASQPHKVRFATSVLADDGRVIASQDDERSTKEIEAGHGSFGYTQQVPLKGLAPGLYILRLEALSTLSPDASARREIQFRVR